LRASIKDGSIANLTQWRPAVTGDIIFIPAGTIHAIGAGIVLAEIQQRSDATFRLFDYGRRRELHEDSAVAVSDAGPLQVQPSPQRLSLARTVLVANPHFVLERIDLAPDSNWTLQADQETWIVVIEGQARIGLIEAAVGDAVFVEADRAGIKVGPDGVHCLIAYPGPDPASSLLHDSGERMTTSSGTPSVRSPKPKEIVGART
jgi:mannose-6-phosphate isomerase